MATFMTCNTVYENEKEGTKFPHLNLLICLIFCNIAINSKLNINKKINNDIITEVTLLMIRKYIRFVNKDKACHIRYF